VAAALHARRAGRHPAHVTILFPFVEPERLREVEVRVAELVAGTAAFELTFARTARWPELLYLEREAGLFVEGHTGRWHEHGRLPLGQSGVA
jgi:2'-5' RNA ligase